MGRDYQILEAQQICRTFYQANKPIQVLKDLSLTLAKGEKLAIIGSSGSGKSTLLHLLGGLDKPDYGSIRLMGQELANLPDDEISFLRNRWLGFIYQFHHLIPEFNALENVSMPLIIRNESVSIANERARVMLEKVGLKNRLAHHPAALSGGERQRVALARALVGKPICVLADEPTGNLDAESAEVVYDLMFNLYADSGTSFIIVTHDARLASRCDRILTLAHGLLS